MKNEAIDTSITEVNTLQSPLPPVVRLYNGRCQAQDIGHLDCTCDMCVFLRYIAVVSFIENDKQRYPAGDEFTAHHIRPVFVRKTLVERLRDSFRKIFRKR